MRFRRPRVQERAPPERPMTEEELWAKVRMYEAITALIESICDRLRLPEIVRRKFRNMADRMFEKAFERFIKGHFQ